MNWLGTLIQPLVDKDDSILDVGCGIMQATDELKCKNILGCDLFPKYLVHIKDRFQTVKISASELDRFMDKSYDIVMCLDVLEHLEKTKAVNVISELKRISRKKVIIYTPKEYNDNNESVENAWGLGYNEAQSHKCVIDRSDLIGFDINEIEGGYFAVWD